MAFTCSNLTPNVDQIPDSFITNAAAQYAANQTVTIAQKVGAANYPFNINLPGSLGPANLIQGQLNRPFPQYCRALDPGYPCCSSRYNAFQATLTKRFNGGGTFLVAYTNAKLLSNTDTLTSWLEGGTTGGVGAVQDWNDLNHEYSLSSQDASQRFVASWVYDLPFGHGQKFMSDATGVKDKLISGWGIDGIVTLQKGFPLKLTTSAANTLFGFGSGHWNPEARRSTGMC